MAKSAAMAATGLRLIQRLQSGAISPSRAISSRTAMKGTIWRVAINKAIAVTAPVSQAAQTMWVSWFFHARTQAVNTNAARTPAAVAGERNLKRSVISQSMRSEEHTSELQSLRHL